MWPSTNGRLFSGASRPSTKTFSHSGQVAHSARATAWRTSNGMALPFRRSLRVSRRSLLIESSKIRLEKLCEGKQYARVRVSRRSVNHLKVVQLWIARKTWEEALPRGFHELFSYRAAEFLLEEITFIPSGTLQCIGDAQPDQKIELGETH